MRTLKKVRIFEAYNIPNGKIWFLDTGISCRFPSPADDFLEERLSLDEKLVRDRDTTFYARVEGSSMTGAGLEDGDLLVIDRSLEPKDNAI